MTSIRTGEPGLLVSSFTSPCWGVALQLRGALLPNFQSTFGVSGNALGLVSTVSSLGFLITIFAVGMSVSRINVRRFLIGGFAASAVLFWVIASMNSYWMLLGIMGLAGLFRGSSMGWTGRC